MAPRVDVGAVMVTFNRCDTLDAALASVREQSHPIVETVVVDNGDGLDGTGAMLAARHPHVQHLVMPENVGYAAGLAAGIRTLMPRALDAVWLLDDDSILERDALERLIAVFASSAAPAVVGPRGGSFHFGWPRWDRLGRALPLGGAWEVDFTMVDGALVAVRSIEEVGLPREDFFMAIEDMEYTSRISAAGHLVVALADDATKRLHLGSLGPWRAYYQTRNHLRMALDRRSPTLLLGWLLRTVAMCALIVQAPDRRMQRLRLRLRGAADGARGRMGRTVEPG